MSTLVMKNMHSWHADTGRTAPKTIGPSRVIWKCSRTFGQFHSFHIKCYWQVNSQRRQRLSEMMLKSNVKTKLWLCRVAWANHGAELQAQPVQKAGCHAVELQGQPVRGEGGGRQHVAVAVGRRPTRAISSSNRLRPAAAAQVRAAQVRAVEVRADQNHHCVCAGHAFFVS